MDIVQRVILQNMDGSREVNNFTVKQSLINSASLIVIDNCYYQYIGLSERRLERGMALVYRQVAAPLWLNNDGTLKKSIPGTLEPEPEVKGTVELKADFVRDPRALDHTLFLLQHNEISLAKAKEIVEYWSVGIDPLSSDLPVVSQDNPLLSENDAPMDILREVREDIIKRREQNVKYAAYLAAYVDGHEMKMNANWVAGLNRLVEYLTADAHGKPVPETLKGPWSFKVGDPRLPKFSISESKAPVEIFQFLVQDDGTLSPEMKAAGVTIEDVPGIGRIASLPIKGIMTGSLVAEKITGIPPQILDDIGEAAFSAMRQFADNVNEVINKFRNPG